MLQVALKPKSPAACNVIRETLLATMKVSRHQYKSIDPTEPLSFPEIPFNLIEQCGTESFDMPFPFTFTFEEDTSKWTEEFLVDKFLSKNKTVVYREVVNSNDDLGPFSGLVRLGGLMNWSPFSSIWPRISSGECILYFDNTWRKEDYESIMSNEATEALAGASEYGTMFMSNFSRYRMTAPAHAAPTKSLATQILSSKDWIFIDPVVSKKLLPIGKTEMATLVDSVHVDHDKYMMTIPRYHVTTKAGQGLYFPEFWLHVVYTPGGLNVMTNWRMRPTVIDAFFNSPHTLKNTFDIVLKLAAKETLFPKWFAEKAITESQDKYVHTLSRLYDMRYAVYEKNAGRIMHWPRDPRRSPLFPTKDL